MKTRAAVLGGPGRIELAQVPVPAQLDAVLEGTGSQTPVGGSAARQEAGA